MKHCRTGGNHLSASQCLLPRFCSQWCNWPIYYADNDLDSREAYLLAPSALHRLSSLCRISIWAFSLAQPCHSILILIELFLSSSYRLLTVPPSCFIPMIGHKIRIHRPRLPKSCSKYTGVFYLPPTLTDLSIRTHGLQQ